MKKKLHTMRLAAICFMAAGIFASCSRQTAYMPLSSPQLEAQQFQAQDAPVVAMEKIQPKQNEVVTAENFKTTATIKTTPTETRKITSIKKLGNKVAASVNKKKIQTAIVNNFALAMSSATMGSKANTDNALASVGIIFLVLGLLSFIIPPLFLTALSIPGIQMLLIIAIALVAVGLLFMATGIARKAE